MTLAQALHDWREAEYRLSGAQRQFGRGGLLDDQSRLTEAREDAVHAFRKAVQAAQEET